MYSMKRTMCPLPRKCRAKSTIVWSLTPRCTTMLTFTGVSPARLPRSMPSSTRATGKSTSFIARKTVSSSESRLTVTRSSPASFSSPAISASREPFVVSVRSFTPSISLEHRDELWQARAAASARRRSSRTFSTPCATKIRAQPRDLFECQDLAPARNSYSRPNTSFGMQ